MLRGSLGCEVEDLLPSRGFLNRKGRKAPHKRQVDPGIREFPSILKAFELGSLYTWRTAPRSAITTATNPRPIVARSAPLGLVVVLADGATAPSEPVAVVQV